MRRAYKFLSAHWGAEAIRARRIKISDIASLNDPWDHRGLKFANKARDEPLWNKVLSMAGQSTGLICFSKSWDDPVLWSHYAESHKGIALGFDLADEDNSGGSNYSEVEYVQELRPFSTDFFKELPSFETALPFIKQVIATKYENWAYEDEIRFFASLSDVDEATGLFFMDFGESMVLKEVIFGCRYSHSDEMTAILSRLRKMPDVECWKACLGNESFRLVRDPSWNYFKKEI